MKICGFRFRFGLADDSFPIQPRTFEIQQERQFEPADRKIADHLGDMCFVKSSDHLRINHNDVIYDQIWYEIANKVTVVENRKTSLHINHMAASLKLQDQSALVEFLVQSGL